MQIVSTEQWRTDRRWPLALAIVFLLIYVASVVAGSALQAAVHLPLRMGWFQEVFAAASAVGFAWCLRGTSELTGWRAPSSGWIRAALLGGGLIVLGGVLASLALPPESTHYSLEYFLYEATAPGVGEEMGLRGPWLALVLLGVHRHPRLQALPYWAIITLSATPFAALHLLESSGLKLAVLFGFTLYAGVILSWVRLRHASVWPAIAAHNVANVALSAISWLTG